VTTTATAPQKARRRPIAKPEAFTATVAQDELVRALRYVSSATDRHYRLAGGITLTHDGTHLTVAYVGFERQATARLLCAGKPGRVYVYPHPLLAAVAAIGRRTTVHLNAPTAGRLTVSGAGAWYHLLLDKPSDIDDPFADRPVRQVGTLTGEALASVARVAFATSRDETLPILTAVRLAVGGGGVSATATDRYRLARATALIDQGDADVTDLTAALVPAATIRALAARWRTARAVSLLLLPSDQHGRGWLRWTADGETWTQQLIEGEYPKVETLFPSDDRATWLDVDRDAFLDGLTKARALAAQRDPVTVTVVDERGSDKAPVEGALVARLTGTSDAGETSVDVPLLDVGNRPDDAPPFTFAIAHQFAPDGVRALDATRVRLALDDASPSTKPVLITQSPVKPEPAAGDLTATPEADDHLVSILMPVRMAG
jgi:DNA polymerase III sliding clamp (beta) subunit (PCNA family)